MSKNNEDTAIRNPLVIYIGEQHDNMAYGSLVEQIIKDSESKGLKVQVFSEFETQTQKIKREIKLGESLRNVPEDSQEFTRITQFLDDNFIKIGDLNEREEVLRKSLQEYQKRNLTPRQLYEETKSQIVVAPEIYQMMEMQLDEGKKTGLIDKGTKQERPFTLDNFYHNFRAQFNHSFVHGRMLEDLRREKQNNTDVVVIVSGFGHTYGLDQELTEFKGCQKYVITNFLDNIPDADLSKDDKNKIRAKETSAKIGIGGLLAFDVDPDTKRVTIPSIVSEALERKVNLEALDLATTSATKTEKSWVEKMADKKLSTSKEGYREI